jgi:NAD(P)-dependent dehydrogenase (short-subunit alcohol dehydrogenase family)
VSAANRVTTAVITGCSTGIGRACVLRLARRGVRVWAGVRRPEDGRSVEEESRRVGAAEGVVRHVVLDVTDQASVREASERIARERGPGDVLGLVNNAGIVVAGPVELLPDEALEHQMAVNFLGAARVTRAFLGQVRRSSGRVVFVSSISGRVAFPFTWPYCASKYALEALADGLRLEQLAAGTGVRVSLIEPGPIATPIWEKSRVASEAAWHAAAAHEPEARGVYAPFMEALRRRAADRGGDDPPARVADAVEHALCSRRPKRRYLVGRRAWTLAAMARWMPTAWMDALIVGRLRSMPEAAPRGR